MFLEIIHVFINISAYKNVYSLTLYACLIVHTIYYIILKINIIDTKINIAINCR